MAVYGSVWGRYGSVWGTYGTAGAYCRLGIFSRYWHDQNWMLKRGIDVFWVFLRAPQHGDSERNFRILRSYTKQSKGRKGRLGTEEKEIEFEREREREIPDFPKPPAPALRFGSMNPISTILGPWEHRGRLQRPESRLVSGQKL